MSILITVLCHFIGFGIRALRKEWRINEAPSILPSAEPSSYEEEGHNSRERKRQADRQTGREGGGRREAHSPRRLQFTPVTKLQTSLAHLCRAGGGCWGNCLSGKNMVFASCLYHEASRLAGWLAGWGSTCNLAACTAASKEEEEEENSAGLGRGGWKNAGRAGRQEVGNRVTTADIDHVFFFAPPQRMINWGSGNSDSGEREGEEGRTKKGAPIEFSWHHSCIVTMATAPIYDGWNTIRRHKITRVRPRGAR